MFRVLDTLGKELDNNLVDQQMKLAEGFGWKPKVQKRMGYHGELPYEVRFFVQNTRSGINDNSCTASSTGISFCFSNSNDCEEFCNKYNLDAKFLEKEKEKAEYIQKIEKTILVLWDEWKKEGLTDLEYQVKLNSIAISFNGHSKWNISVQGEEIKIGTNIHMGNRKYRRLTFSERYDHHMYSGRLDAARVFVRKIIINHLNPLVHDLLLEK